MKKLIYKDTAPGAKEAFVQSATGVEDYSTPSLLMYPYLALPSYFNPCETYTYVLDGNREIIPDDLEGDYAIVSTPASTLGSITTIQTAQAEGEYKSIGISITFDPASGIFANRLSLSWYQGNTLLSKKTFYPNATTYFCQNEVSNYDKIVVEYLHTNMPEARMHVTGFEYGGFRVYTDKDIPKVSLIQEVYPVNLGTNGTTPMVSANTTDFTLRAPADDLSLVFQKKQILEMYFDDVLQSVTMVDTAKRTGETSYDVESSDYVGAVLDKVDFVGGMYDGTTSARSVLESISTQTRVPFEIDEQIDDMLLGYIPYTTCRDALAYICFSIGAVISTANSYSVKIYIPSDDVISTVPVDYVFTEAVTEEDKLTSFELTAFSYTETSEETDVYSGDTGTGIFVTFSEPLHSLSITNGTITSSGANYAIIDANSGCTLTGKKYSVSSSVTTITNPDKLSNDLENTKSVTSCTLINKNNVYNIAKMCYNYYARNMIYKGNIAILNGEKPGDTITQNTRYSGDVTGVMTEKRFNINSTKIVAEVSVR